MISILSTVYKYTSTTEYKSVSIGPSVEKQIALYRELKVNKNKFYILRQIVYVLFFEEKSKEIFFNNKIFIFYKVLSFATCLMTQK